MNDKAKNINQYNVIHLDHENIIVAAGAGTGKTTAMTQRIVRLIETKDVKMNELLVLTFTNAAVDVMKSKIERLLRKHAWSTPDKKQELLEASKSVDQSNIQTFHSFCSDLMKEYHHYLEGVEPVFVVMSESERMAIRKKCFMDAFERYRLNAENHDKLVRVYKLFDSLGTPDSLMEYVLKLCDYAENGEHFEESLCEGYRYYLGNDKEGFQTLCDEKLLVVRMRVQVVIDEFRAIASEAPIINLTSAKGGTLDTSEIFYSRIGELEEALRCTQRGLGMPKSPQWRMKKCEEEFFFCNGVSYDSFRELFEYAKIKFKAVIREMEDLAEWYKVLLRFGDSEYLSEGTPFVDIFETLTELAVSTQANYREEKRKRGAIDFSDQEHFALELLNIEDVRREVSARYRFVFVDENQDTSRIQNAIIWRVSGEASVFKVGDVKQSIYSFRNADPSAFQAESSGVQGYIYDMDSEYGEGNLSCENQLNDASRVVIPMNQNYRNRPAILDFVNTVFKEEMPHLYEHASLKSGKTKSFDVMEKDDPEVALHTYQVTKDLERVFTSEGEGLQESGQKSGKHRVREEIECYDGDDVREEKAFDSGLTAPELEAKYIAQKVLWLVQEKNSKFKDIAILYRSTRGISPYLRRAFDELGIPLEMEDEGGFYEKPEIALLISAVQGILNPYDDTSLLALLLSPFFEVTMEEVLALSLLKQKKGFSSYYSVLSFIAVLENRVEKFSGVDAENEFDFFPASLREKLTAVYEKIRWLRGVSKYINASEFVWKLYDENQFYEKMGEYADGASMQKSLVLFAEMIHGMNMRIDECLDYLRESDTSPKISSNSSSESDAVKLMTIHHSKGMEFENVIVGGIFKKYNLKDSGKKLVLNRKAGFALKNIVSETGVKIEHPLLNLVKQTVNEEQIAEEIRVLYVAMTRAEKRLIFMGANTKQNPEANSIAHLLFKYIEPSEFRFNGRRFSSEQEKGERVQTSQKLHYIGELSIKDLGLKKGRRPLFDKDYALDYGTRVHRALELCNFKDIFSPLNVLSPSIEIEGNKVQNTEKITNGTEIFALNIPQETKKAIEEKISAYSDLKPVQNFLRSDMAMRIACAEEVYKEEDFVYYTDEGKIQGIIDLFFIENEKIVLLDYKTDTFETEDDVEAIKERYKGQLKTYKEFLETFYQKSVEEVYLCLLHGEGRVVNV